MFPEFNSSALKSTATGDRSLPEPKGKVRRSVSKDNALRSKLLQIETTVL